MFKDRVVQYPNRYDLIDTNGNHGFSVNGETLEINTGPFTLSRNEGTVTEAGTLLNAVNLTDNIDEIATSHFDSGVTAGISVAAGAFEDVAITFSQSFTTAPSVVVGFLSSSTAPTFGSCSVAVNSVTTSGFTIRVFNNDSATRAPAVEWIAFGS